MTVGGQPRWPGHTARFLIRRIITIERQISKSDWSVAERTADRYRSQIVTSVQSWYTLRRPNVGAHSELR
jgi:hypothetical protein